MGDESLIKLHIHTNNPDQVIKIALEAGEIQDVKIDNMRLQHSEYLIKKQADSLEPLKEWGIAAVAQGKGLEEIFRDLGVDLIIPGGQTINPSVEEILKAFEQLKAKNVFLLVNNRNVALAAEEAKKLLRDKEIFLVKTTHMVEGIAALLRFNSEISPEENLTRMEEARQEIQVVDITTAQRDGSLNGVSYLQGDYIALAGKNEVIAVAKELREIAINALDNLGIKEGSLITIYAGEGIEEDVFLKDEISQRFKVEVEWYYGGQPHYPLYLAIE